MCTHWTFVPSRLYFLGTFSKLLLQLTIMCVFTLLEVIFATSYTVHYLKSFIVWTKRHFYTVHCQDFSCLRLILLMQVLMQKMTPGKELTQLENIKKFVIKIVLLNN